LIAVVVRRDRVSILRLLFSVYTCRRNVIALNCAATTFCQKRNVIGCLHDPANVQQTSSINTCILSTFVGSLLDVCWIV